MEKIDFVRASQMLNGLNPELEALLRVIWGQTSSQEKEHLCCYLAKYPFASFLIKSGVPLGPDQTLFPKEIITRSGLPFGIILNNSVEVIDEVIRQNGNIDMSQSLLARNQLIGVFELIDELLNVKGRPPEDWTISAGATSLKFLDFPTQKVQWNRLRARHPQLTTYEKKIARTINEMELLRAIGWHKMGSADWFTEIMYFAPSWFTQIERQMAGHETRAGAMELISYFQNLAWQSLAKVRDRQIKLEDALNEHGGNPVSAKCKAAYLLIRHSMDILSQRRPCFAPMDEESALGPLRRMRKEIHHVAKINEGILVPTYLPTGGVGFMSLSQLAPSAFVDDPASSLEDVLKIIVRARNATLERKIRVPGLVNASEVLSRLTFRVKTGRKNHDDSHSSISAFRVRLLPPGNAKQFEKHTVTLAEFYDPFFSEEAFPPPDGRFFRVAVKLDLRAS